MVARNNNQLQEQEIEAHRLLTQSMNMLSERIQRTETDFVGHLRKVEERLDQIVELTKTVAVLQQQSSQQADQVVEVRTQIRDFAQKFDNSITRLHTRLDEAAEHNRDRIDILSKETELSIKEAKSIASNTEKELKAWLNRGWGAWIILVLFISITSTGFYKWVDSLEKDKEVATRTTSSLVGTVDKHSSAIQLLTDETKDIRQAQKRAEQISIDTERQLEYLRNRGK